MVEGRPEYIIRVLRKDEIPHALQIWKETGMQEGTECLHTWLQVDPECCKVAVTTSGDYIGVCSGVILHDDLAFFGLYAVREKYRGMGIGVKLWKSCLDRIADMNAAVNAAPGKLELYRDRGGFPIEETKWHTAIYVTEKDIDHSPLLDSVPGIKITKISSEVLPKVIEYDTSIVRYCRQKAISLTVEEVDTVAVVALEDTPKETVKGYGVLKKSVQGCGIVGPLYADSQDVAEVLLKHMMQSLPEVHGLALMSTSVNSGARRIAEKLGIPEIEQDPRCYRKYIINADLSKIYGQLDLNFSPF